MEGRVRAVEIRPVERNSMLAAEIADSTGDLTALFMAGRISRASSAGPGWFRGPVGIRDGRPVMINPAYELLFRRYAGSGQTPRAGTVATSPAGRRSVPDEERSATRRPDMGMTTGLR